MNELTLSTVALSHYHLISPCLTARECPSSPELAPVKCETNIFQAAILQNHTGAYLIIVTTATTGGSVKNFK